MSYLTGTELTTAIDELTNDIPDSKAYQHKLIKILCQNTTPKSKIYPNILLECEKHCPRNNKGRSACIHALRGLRRKYGMNENSKRYRKKVGNRLERATEKRDQLAMDIADIETRNEELLRELEKLRKMEIQIINTVSDAPLPISCTFSKGPLPRPIKV